MVMGEEFSWPTVMEGMSSRSPVAPPVAPVTSPGHVPRRPAGRASPRSSGDEAQRRESMDRPRHCVSDERRGAYFEIHPERDLALDRFYHRYVYYAGGHLAA